MKLTPLLSIVYTAGAISLLLATLFDVHTISGDSMSPNYRDSETVFVFRWAYGLQPPFIHRYIVKWGEVEEGDVMVLREPERGSRVIKRCIRIDSATGELFVRGDNPSKSRDSRHYGSLVPSRVEGKVLTEP